MSYFKTNAPGVLKAWHQEREAVAALRAEARTFAARFGGTECLYGDPARFAGLRFQPPAPRDLWRLPDRDGIQCPRSAPRRGATAETKEAHARLLAEWKANVPTARVDSNALYAALGVGWGDFLLCGGLVMFEHGGWLYAKTGADMPCMTEILGSEYEAARKAASA